MAKLKTFIQNTTWIKLKAIKKAEEEKLAMRKAESEKLRQKTMLARKATIAKKEPYDSQKKLKEKNLNPEEGSSDTSQKDFDKSSYGSSPIS